MAYLLDADVFIRAKNDHYSFDTVPGFWDWLHNANARGDVFSIQRVRDELLAGATSWPSGQETGRTSSSSLQMRRPSLPSETCQPGLIRKSASRMRLSTHSSPVLTTSSLGRL